MIVSFQVEGKRVGVHECLPTLPKNVTGDLKVLHFDPAHVLLHRFHAFLHLIQELVLQSQRFVMIVVALVVVKVTLQGGSRAILVIARPLRVVFIEAIAVVPRRPMRLPRAQADPTEFIFTRLILADKMIAASILL